MESSGVRHHAVVVPYPTQGHISPLMHLAKQLAMQGAMVTFVNTSHNHQRIVDSQEGQGGWDQHQHGHRIRLVHIPDGLPDHHDRMSDFAMLSEAIETHMPEPFHSLMAELSQSSHPPSCVFSDLLMLFTQDVANAFHLPRVVVWLQSASSFAINLHIPQLVSEGVIPIKPEEDSNSIITSIPGHPPFAFCDLPSIFQEDISSYMFQFKLRPFERLQEAKGILINTFYELEREILDLLHEKHRVLAAGPFLPPALLDVCAALKDMRTGTGLWQEDRNCFPWLDKQEECSVLYISFGSIASLSSEQFRELVLGLDASEKPILWAIRPDLMDLIAPALPPHFLGGGTGGRVYLTSWAPQALVLSHPSIGAFLTHCGWNSTLESISMGVPTLCWPYFSDQMLNRKWMVEEWKVGKRFQPSSDGMVKKEEVDKLVKLMMDSPEGREMRERARALSKAARKAVKEMGSSYLSLQSLLHSLL